MPDEIVIRPLRAEDRAEWEILWKGYQVFYRADIPAEVTDLTWARFHDPAAPMPAMGPFNDGHLEGIVHYIFHRSCWTKGDYCYLQDLFTRADLRGKGIGRQLIEAVKAVAAAAGASRV